MPAHRVPLASPEGNVGRISLELASQRQRDNELDDEALNRDHGNHAEERRRELEVLQDEHDFEHDQKDNDRNGMGNGSKNTAKLLAAHAQQRSHAARHAEQATKYTGIDSHGSKSDNQEADQGGSRLNVFAVVRSSLTRDTSLRVDEQVRNDRQADKDEGSKDLGPEKVGNSSPGNIARKFAGRVSDNLALETRDSGTREAAECDPRGGVRARVTTREPAEVLAVVDEEIAPRELVRVVEEGRDDQGHERDPEVDQGRSPNSQAGKQQHHDQSGSEVDRRASETGVQHTEGNTRGGETTTGTDIPGTTEGQILLDRVGVDLADEHLEERRQREDLLEETSSRADHTLLHHLLNNQGNESEEEDEENGENAAVDPIQKSVGVGAASGEEGIGDGDIAVVLAADRLMTQYADVNAAKHEELDREHNEHVVQVETGMGVVEGQETIEGELSSEVVVLAREHLFTHTSSDLGGEVENGAETQITTLAALVVLAVLDTATTQQSVHTSVNIFVEMQTLLSLGDTTTGGHEDTVEEIGMTVMELATNLGQGSGEEGTECLFLTGGDITKNTNVLRENVLAGTKNGNRVVDLVLDTGGVR